MRARNYKEIVGKRKKGEDIFRKIKFKLIAWTKKKMKRIGRSYGVK